MSVSSERVRYAVVGQGWYLRQTVLPAFAEAGENSVLAAVVSGDRSKRENIARRYGVADFSFEDYDDLLSSGGIDAVYLALPISLRREFAVRAARSGVHVLCEKPIADTLGACEEILEECWAHGARLMGADPSRFEEGSLEAAEVVRSGTLGEPRLFSSVFTREAGPADEAGREVPPAAAAAGSAFAMSTACISAARSLFEEEPVEVSASALAGPPEPGADPELFSAVLRFAGGRLASFTCGFGSANVAEYRVVGTGGDLRVERAYGAGADLCHHLTVGGCTQTRRFRRRGQVAPELVYFSDCILYAREPDPDGLEALTDVGVVEAIRRSLAVGRAVGLGPAEAGRQGAFGPAGGHVAVPGPGRAPGWAAAAVPAYGAAR